MLFGMLLVEEELQLLDRGRNLLESFKEQVIPLRRKIGRDNQMPFLPDEIIFKIFLLLPAKVLQEVMRLVCRSWRKVICNPLFTKELCSHSTYKSPYGILKPTLKCMDYFELYSLNIDETTGKLTKRINQRYLADGVGLILTASTRDDGSLIYLLNPITMQVVTLPYFPIKYHPYQNWAVGYSLSTSKYKVLCTDLASMRDFMLTVGVDKQWREKVYYTTALFSLCPQEIWGYMYWYNSQRVILLDLEKEILYKVIFRGKHEGHWQTVLTPISSDRNLCFGIKYDVNCWHFWELVDFKNGGGWRKFGNVDINCKLSEINKIMGLSGDIEMFCCRPIIKGKDEVIFQHPQSDYIFAYNFKKGTFYPSFATVPQRLKLMFANSLVDPLT